MTFRIGVDIGGTFTDFTVVTPEGELLLWKEDTTPEDPAQAIQKGMRAVSEQLGLSERELLNSTSLFVHGTTIATNTLIQRNGPRVGLLCTEGFRDVLYLRDGFKPERFNVHMEHPGAFVDRFLRLGVRERIAQDGSVLEPLDADSVRRAAARFKEAKVQAVAIAFLWSIVNPNHERRAREILAEELPGVPIICSSEVLPEIREWERTSSTVLSAYIYPKISGYLHELENYLEGSGFGRGPLIMQINGGCASVEEILNRPVNVLASGPAAAPAAAQALIDDSPGESNVITIDMGGTSLDVCMVRDGRATMSRDVQVEMQPIGVPAVEVRSIGAGGGSIAWIDSGGALRVGPQSAGARPGPAAYGMGGTEPTVTDANVVLGLLAPEAFLGGRRNLDLESAKRAVLEKVGNPLGLDPTEAAAGIIKVVNSNMVAAIRGVSIERGIDPRNFTLVAGGGAGGLHAVALARSLGMSRVLVPREAGTLCSFGMTVTDVRLDGTITAPSSSDAGSFSEIDEAMRELEADLRERLSTNGIAPEDIAIERGVDARYPGQVHELTIPFAGDSSRQLASCIADITADFHAEHKREFTYARTEMPVEFLHWRVTSVGKSHYVNPLDHGKPAAKHEAKPIGTREAFSLAHDAMIPMAVYSALDLVPGSTATGPLVIQSATTTVVLDEGDSFEVRHDGGLLIEVATER